MADAADSKARRPQHGSSRDRIIRQVLKTANRHGWLPYLPDRSVPYKTFGKITHRA
jgi:hypothetical protein